MTRISATPTTPSFLGKLCFVLDSTGHKRGRGLEASEKIMESCMAINLPLFFDRS
jgi:hypothetical protein